MKKGFTLIELLVVIATISILAGVILASLNSSRAKSRDSFRRQSLVQIRTALELYFSNYGSYPSTGGVWYTSYPSGEQGVSDNGGNWIPGLVASGVISSIPTDPLQDSGFSSLPACSGTWHRSFLYNSTNGSGYKLVLICAYEGTISPSDPFYDSIRANYAGLQICAGSDCSL